MDIVLEAENVGAEALFTVQNPYAYLCVFREPGFVGGV